MLDCKVRYNFVHLDNIVRNSFTFPMSEKSEFRSCLVAGFHKSGTVLINKIVSEIMCEFEIPTIDFPGHLFSKGVRIDSVQWNMSALFRSQGYCFMGFRTIPLSMSLCAAIIPLRKIFLVRNPLDIIVSYYFSIRHSHWFPTSGSPDFKYCLQSIKNDACSKTLDEFALNNSWFLLSEFLSAKILLNLDNVKVFRYEDVVFDKTNFVRNISEWLKLDLRDEKIEDIAIRNNVVPTTENIESHIRQVYPGDGARKLKPETRTALEGVFSEFMQKFGY